MAKSTGQWWTFPVAPGRPELPQERSSSGSWIYSHAYTLRGMYLLPFLKCPCSFSFCCRFNCPRGGSGVQRLHALACCKPSLGCSELWQGEGHGGDEHRSFLVSPQDALVASGHLWPQRPFTPHTAGAAAVDLPLFGPLLHGPGAPKQSQPRQWLRRGCNSSNISVAAGCIQAGARHVMVYTLSFAGKFIQNPKTFLYPFFILFVFNNSLTIPNRNCLSALGLVLKWSLQE